MLKHYKCLILLLRILHKIEKDEALVLPIHPPLMVLSYSMFLITVMFTRIYPNPSNPFSPFPFSFVKLKSREGKDYATDSDRAT